MESLGGCLTISTIAAETAQHVFGRSGTPIPLVGAKAAEWAGIVGLILVEYGVRIVYSYGVMPTCQGQTMEFSGRGDVVSLKPAPGRISRLRV